MIIQMRALRAEDRLLLAAIMAGIPSFTTEDQRLALELVDIALDRPAQRDYEFILAVDASDRLLAYACFGPTPLAEGVFTLYWIAVDHTLAGCGIGSTLLKAVESHVCSAGGRMLFLETSSSGHYALTRSFYLKNSYELAETFRDFYHPGEHRLTFVKRFSPNGV